MKFTVDTRNRDFIESLTDQTSAVIPALTLGDKFPVSFQFGKDGAIAESIGTLDTVEVALSSCVTPDRGTFRLFAPGGLITGDPITIPATVGDRTLKSMIAAAWDGVSISDLCITGRNGFFRVEFQGNLADAEIDPMTGDGTKLSPRSVVSVNQKEAGGGGKNAVQIISLDSVPLAYAADLTFDDGVFSGILNFDTVAANEAMREADKGRVSRLLSVRVTDGEGNRTTYAKRPVIVDCTGIPMGPFSSDVIPQFLTLGQGDNRYDRTVVDVRRFGAKIDGVHDDAPAIQAAIDICSALGGGTVFIPAGTYYLNGTVRQRDGVTLAGSGMEATILKWDENADLDLQDLKPHHGIHTVKWGGDGVTKGCRAGITTAREDGEGTVIGARVRDLTIDINRDDPPDIDDSQTGGLHVYNALDFRADRVRVKNVIFNATSQPHWGDGFMVAHSRRIWINDCEAYHCGKSGIAIRNEAKEVWINGVYVEESKERSIHLGPESEDVFIDNARLNQDFVGSVLAGAHGINLQGCTHTKISNVHVYLGEPTVSNFAMIVRALGAHVDSAPKTVEVINFHGFSGNNRAQIAIQALAEGATFTNCSASAFTTPKQSGQNTIKNVQINNMRLHRNASAATFDITDGSEIVGTNIHCRQGGAGYVFRFRDGAKFRGVNCTALAADSTAFRVESGSNVRLLDPVADAGPEGGSHFFAGGTDSILQVIGGEHLGSGSRVFTTGGGAVEDVHPFPPAA